MGRNILRSIFVAAVFLFVSYTFSYCETIKASDLVKQYSKATALQRQEIEATYKYQEIFSSGIVKDVVEWEVFDDNTDKGEKFYRVTTQMQNADVGISYQMLVLFKDKLKAEQFSKGQNIKAKGYLIKIVDEIGYFSVWVCVDELTPEDKLLLAK